MENSQEVSEVVFCWTGHIYFSPLTIKMTLAGFTALTFSPKSKLIWI